MSTSGWLTTVCLERLVSTNALCLMPYGLSPQNVLLLKPLLHHRILSPRILDHDRLLFGPSYG